MTGVYVRVQRDGKWVNVELEHLTKEERHLFFERSKNNQTEILLAYIDALCDTLVAIED